MTTLEQQQKEAHERFDEKVSELNESDYQNETIVYFGYRHIDKDNNIHTVVDWGSIKSFLDTEIAKAYKAGQESVFKRVNRKLKGWEYTFQGVCQYCSADFWNYDNAKHTSQCPMGKLEEVLNIIKSLSTEKLTVTTKDEK